MLSLLLCCVLCIGCSKEEDTTGATLSGIISDSQTGKPLAGAKVKIESVDKEWITGFLGAYEFRNLPTVNNPYTVLVEKENYHTERKEVFVEAGKSTKLDIALGPPITDFSILPLSIDFGYDLNTASVDIVNTGDFPINWKILSIETGSITHADSIKEFITCHPTSGRIEVGAKQTITLNINRSSYPADELDEGSLLLEVEGENRKIPLYIKIPPKEAPTVNLSEVTVISYNSALFRGTITSTGSSQVVRHGFCWSEFENPTIANSDTCNLGNSVSGKEMNYTVSSLKSSTTYYVRAYAENAEGISYSTQQQFVTSNAPEDTPVTTLTTTSPTEITTTSAILGGIIIENSGNNLTECGVCWSTTQNPTMADNHAVANLSGNSFSIRVENLSQRTLYHVRAYAIADDGTVYYGNNVTFQTTHTINPPQVSSVSVSNIKVTAATLQATLINDGEGTITDVGFVYATHSNPTVDDHNVSCGAKTSSFSYEIDNLKENTTYYVRAYATNEAGTSYGEEITTFTTLEIKQPTLSNVTVSSVSHKSASFSAQVEQTNNGTITEVGFVYSTNPNPELTDYKMTCDTGLSFSGRISSLTPNTTYYVRAYASNEKGTAFSEQVEFRTKEKPEDSSFEIGDFGDVQEWD